MAAELHARVEVELRHVEEPNQVFPAMRLVGLVSYP